MKKEKGRIIFRADGSAKRGYGHVMRCIALSDILKRKFHCLFVIQNPDHYLEKEIRKASHEIVKINAGTSQKAELKELVNNLLTKEDIVVIDGYDFSDSYLRGLKENCFKLVLIDDIPGQQKIADVIINHAEGVKKSDYPLGINTRLYLGSRYAILRKPFLHRAGLTGKKTEAGRVFINMGGTDPGNHTLKSLKICLKNKAVTSVDIVIGSFYLHRQELSDFIRSHSHVSMKLHTGLSAAKMASLMSISQAGICSASTVSYEYANTGGILFIVKTADNQKNIFSSLLKSGVAFSQIKFNETFTRMRDKQSVLAYYKNRKRYFPGDSDKNLLSVFEKITGERSLKIRKADVRDMETYYKWANDPTVRNSSIHSAKIKLNDHKQWFAKKIEDRNAALFIIENDGRPLGQVRFDKEKDTAVIDYSIDARFRGQGFGEVILRKAITELRKFLKPVQVVASVKKNNSASNAVFENLGFKKVRSSIINSESYIHYTLTLCVQ